MRLAEYLLGAGFDVNAPAFVEGAFQATPLWYAISRGRNLSLARLLLKNGSTPEYSLWAAAFADNVGAIDLLIGNGASVDPVTEDETPFLGAIKWSRFARRSDRGGQSPLDMVANRRDKTYFERFTSRGAGRAARRG